MISKPVRALLWQQWRQCRWLMLLAFAVWFVFPLYDSLMAYMSGFMRRDMYDGELLSFLRLGRAGQSFLVLFFVLSGYTAMTRFNVGDIRTAASHFPRRYYLLPVRTNILVRCEFFGRLSSVAFLGLAMILIHVLIYGGPGWLWVVPLFFVALCACMMGVSWFLRSFGIVINVVAFGVAFAVFAWTAVSLKAPQYVVIALHILLVPVLLAVSYTIARIGVAYDRRGESGGMLSGLSSDEKTTGGRVKPFASAESAQLWYELKRIGKPIPVYTLFCAVGMLFLLYFVVTFTISRTNDLFGTMAVPALLSGLFLATFIVGSGRAERDLRESGGKRNSFMSLRPMSTPAMADARFKAGAYGILLTSTVVLIFSFSNSYFAEMFFVPGHGMIELVFFSVLGILIITEILLWGVLWIGTWISLLWLIVGCVISGGAAAGFDDVDRLLWPLIPLLTVPVFFAAWYRGLISLSRILAVSAAWMVIFGFLMIANQGDGSEPKMHFVHFLLRDLFGFKGDPIKFFLWNILEVKENPIKLACFCMLPFISFASLPLEMDWLRHRSVSGLRDGLTIR